MRLSPSDRQVLIDRLAEEGELAVAAAVASDVADHHDRNMAALLTSGDPAVVALAIARLTDKTVVRRSAPPHEALEGGYGKSFGVVTVADKARFLLERLLGPEGAASAVRGGPDWWERERQARRWDAAAGRFVAR